MFLASFNKQQKEAFFCLAHDVVVSDGDLSVGEQIMMEDMRQEMSLDLAFEPHYLDIDGMDQIFDTHRSRTIAIISLIRLGYADGAFEIEEQSFLKLLCHTFEIADSEFVLIENWVRRLNALEEEGKAFL